MRAYSADTFLAAIREPAAVLDHEGRIHAVNAAWSQVSADQALAGGGFGAGCDYLERCMEVRGGDPTRELTQEIRGILAGAAQALTIEYACEQAAPPRHFEIVASALPSADGAGALVIHRDITAQKRLAETHRETEAQLRYVLDLLPEGYWDWMVQTGYVYYSDRWCEALGFAPSEIERRVEAWSNLLHPDDRDRVLAALTDFVEGRVPVYDIEARVRRKDGTYRWELDRGRIVSRDANGKALRVVGMEIDISERKQAELLVEEQTRRLMALSTPLIPISDQVVVMPLIGTVDAQRGEQVLSTLLHGLSQTRARVAILDITGVSLIDAHVAEGLVKAARAVQLLGAQVVLTGVRPEVATILVGLAIDWGNIVMRGTLQSGIAYATSFEQRRASPPAI